MLTKTSLERSQISHSRRVPFTVLFYFADRLSTESQGVSILYLGQIYKLQVNLNTSSLAQE